jgi:hypothetical protein
MSAAGTLKEMARHVISHREAHDDVSLTSMLITKQRFNNRLNLSYSTAAATGACNTSKV